MTFESHTDLNFRLPCTLSLTPQGAGVISKSVKPRVNEATGRSSIGVQMASHVEKVRKRR